MWQLLNDTGEVLFEHAQWNIVALEAIDRGLLSRGRKVSVGLRKPGSANAMKYHILLQPGYKITETST